MDLFVHSSGPFGGPFFVWGGGGGGGGVLQNPENPPGYSLVKEGCDPMPCNLFH